MQSLPSKSRRWSKGRHNFEISMSGLSSITVQSTGLLRTGFSKKCLAAPSGRKSIGNQKWHSDKNGGNRLRHLDNTRSAVEYHTRAVDASRSRRSETKALVQ